MFDTYAIDLRAKVADAGPPTVHIDEPAGPTVVTDAFRVRATANDDVRVEKVDVMLDDRIVAIAPASPFEVSRKSLGTPDGPYTLRARAFDIAGRAPMVGPR